MDIGILAFYFIVMLVLGILLALIRIAEWEHDNKLDSETKTKKDIKSAKGLALYALMQTMNKDGK